MRCPNIMRLLAATAAACALFLAAPSPSLATCDCTTTHTRNNLPICLGDSTYYLSVEFCETEYTPPSPFGSCTPTLKQNRVSYIRKICFQGARPVGYTNTQVIEALYCLIRGSVCTVPNPFGITVPAGSPGIYCREVRAPKCTMQDINGCIIPCGDDCNWCYYNFRWTNIAGDCSFDFIISTSCDLFNQNCESGCEQPDRCYEPACCN